MCDGWSKSCSSRRSNRWVGFSLISRTESSRLFSISLVSPSLVSERVRTTLRWSNSEWIQLTDHCMRCSVDFSVNFLSFIMCLDNRLMPSSRCLRTNEGITRMIRFNSRIFILEKRFGNVNRPELRSTITNSVYDRSRLYMIYYWEGNSPFWIVYTHYSWSIVRRSCSVTLKQSTFAVSGNGRFSPQTVVKESGCSTWEVWYLTDSSLVFVCSGFPRSSVFISSSFSFERLF